MADRTLHPQHPPVTPFDVETTTGCLPPANFPYSRVIHGAHVLRRSRPGARCTKGVGRRDGGIWNAIRFALWTIRNHQRLQSAGNAALGYESRYDLCKCSGFWARSKHAIARNFYTYNSTEREKRSQIPLYAGAFGAGMISSVWLPGHRSAWEDGAYAALGQAVYGSGINWVSEFAIDILRKVTSNRYPRTPD